MAIVRETSFMFCLNVMEKQNLVKYYLKVHYNNLVQLFKGLEHLWGTDYETHCPARSKPLTWQILCQDPKMLKPKFPMMQLSSVPFSDRGKCRDL